LTYDLVVIDTPPLVAVPDTFALLSRVDGVVIVGWVGHSRRDAAEELQQILAASDVPLLGVIANGATSSGARSYATAQGGKARSVTSAAAGSPAGEFAQASES
jgi:Mrp family chromosome partitioning ATPase